MKYELSTYKLGKLLHSLTEDYDVNMWWRAKLSGGFITITGKVKVEYYPTEQVMLKGNNIISLRVKNNDGEGNSLKITGIKGQSFKIEIAPTKFKEIKSNSLYLNKIQESKSECKIKVDEDIILTIPVAYDEIVKNINI